MLWTWPKSTKALVDALKCVKRPRYRNRKYLDSFKDSHCMASDNGIDMCEAPAIPAHIRTGHEGGGSLKPDDSLVYPLCDRHHKIQHSMNEAEFIVNYVFKPICRRMFTSWHEKNH